MREMDHSIGQHQEIAAHSLENMMVCQKSQQERKPRPQPEHALKCPRCESTNTKFCYYNNYSLSQPRYFCKSCRRYWTKGGTLRNVPVGGGCRKNKRSSSSTSSSSSSSSSRRSHDQLHAPDPNCLTGLPPLAYEPNDLSLALARLQRQSCGQMGFEDYDLSLLGISTNTNGDILGNSGLPISATNSGFLEALRNGFSDRQSTFQNMYYGFGGERTVGFSGSDQMGVLPGEEISSNATTTAVTVTTIKQEVCGGKESQSRILWGFPWQANGGDGNMGETIDSGRESWNGINSSWHGLLNSPLM